ncbi:copper resistance protein CopC [Dactylosporangium sp. NPDC005572]|uniref:copper resistance CopC family protein n=1 Tax=Dactylosporangium sp. NPDC005572 TaxID=3156889 RepID=UPI0033A56F72
MRSVTVMLLTLTAVFAVLMPATPAAAHGQLAMSDPVADSTISEPRQELKLYFTEQPASFAWFTVTAPSGVRVDGGWRSGEPKRLDKPVQEYFLVDGKFEPKTYHTGFPAVLTVSHWPEAGVYVAAYQSVASDGEPVKGTLKFTYAGSVTAPPAGWSAPTDGPSQSLSDALAGKTTGQQPAFPTATAAAPAPTAPAPAAPFVLTDWLIPGLIIAGVAVMIGTAARREPVPVAKKRRRSATAGSRRSAGSGG